jgi:rhodanese-related sulfurtransferase
VVRVTRPFQYSGSGAFCERGGKRSQRALEYLRDQAGFRKLKNLKGGIDLWAQEVDPSVPRY